MLKEILDWLKNIETYTITNIFNFLNNKKYKFQKNKNITYKIIEPPKVDYTDKKISVHVQKSKYKEEVEKFISTLESKLPDEALKSMYHNLQSLKINDSKNPIIAWRYSGLYSIIFNSIKLFSNRRTGTITHELLHMASAKYVNNTINPITNGYLCGFNNGFVGRSLNEGYTEVLNNRLFGHPITNANSYSLYARVVSMIEDIVGKEKMTNLYFDANLKVLFNILSSYSSEKETSVFLRDLDTYFSLSIGKKGLGYYLSNKKFNQICKYLTSISLNYAKIQVQNGTMSNEEQKIFLNNCRNKLFSIKSYIDKLPEKRKKKTSKSGTEIIDNNSKQETSEQQNIESQKINHDKTNYSYALNSDNNAVIPQIESSKVKTKIRGNISFNLVFFINIILAMVITAIYLVFLF